MDNVNILSISSKDLASGKYKKLLPEYYELFSVVENNPWHAKQNVFDHSVAVFKGLEETLKLDFLDEKRSSQINKHLDQKVGKHSRRELLMIGTLLHDIAKTDLLITDENGNTRCPGHEAIASSRVKNYADRFNLDEKDQERVENLVLYHGFVGTILDLVVNNKKINQHYKFFEQVVGSLATDILLFFHSDILGSDLEQLSPKDFETYLKTVENLLKHE